MAYFYSSSAKLILVIFLVMVGCLFSFAIQHSPLRNRPLSIVQMSPIKSPSTVLTNSRIYPLSDNLKNHFSSFALIFVVANCFAFAHPLIASGIEPSPSNLPVYRSGKNPDVSASKDSKVGTKKDINFLRCMSNCKSNCQLPGEGLAKTDCVQDCQDQCCDSYEQCSFKIKINTGNAI